MFYDLAKYTSWTTRKTPQTLTIPSTPFYVLIMKNVWPKPPLLSPAQCVQPEKQVTGLRQNHLVIVWVLINIKDPNEIGIKTTIKGGTNSIFLKTIKGALPTYLTYKYTDNTGVTLITLLHKFYLMEKLFKIP